MFANFSTDINTNNDETRILIELYYVYCLFVDVKKSFNRPWPSNSQAKLLDAFTLCAEFRMKKVDLEIDFWRFGKDSFEMGWMDSGEKCGKYHFSVNYCLYDIESLFSVTPCDYIFFEIWHHHEQQLVLG